MFFVDELHPHLPGSELEIHNFEKSRPTCSKYMRAQNFMVAENTRIDQRKSRSVTALLNSIWAWKSWLLTKNENKRVSTKNCPLYRFTNIVKIPTSKNANFETQALGPNLGKRV